MKHNLEEFMRENYPPPPNYPTPEEMDTHRTQGGLVNLSQILLLLFVGAIAGLIFAAQLPGTWWQWLLLALLLFTAAGVASASEGNPRG